MKVSLIYSNLQVAYFPCVRRRLSGAREVNVKINSKPFSPELFHSNGHIEMDFNDYSLEERYKKNNFPPSLGV